MNYTEICQNLFDVYVAAYRAGDASGCAAVFGDDATITSPYAPPARGRRAIERLHADWLAEGSEGKVVLVLEAGGSGDIAWCFAAFGEGNKSDEGTSLNVLKRHPGGEWLIEHCSLNETLHEPG